MGNYLYKKAVERGHLKWVKLLLALGADINCINLYYAGSEQVALYLIDQGKEIEEGNLHSMVCDNYLGAVKCLVEKHHAMIRKIDVQSAAYDGYLDILRYLVAHSQDCRPDGILGGAAQLENNLSVVKFLVEECGVDIRDAESNLEWILIESDLDTIKYLVERGISLCEVEETIMDEYFHERHPEIATYLRQHLAFQV